MIRRTAFILLSFLGLFALYMLETRYQKQTNQPEIEPVEHFIVIGVDGLSVDGIRKASTPNIDKLMNEGSYTLRARAVIPTNSSTNWASMITGVGPAQHGITNNRWEKYDHELPPVTVGEDRMPPTIFSEIRKQRRGADVGVIYHWLDFGRIYDSNSVTYEYRGFTEQKAADVAGQYLKDKEPLYTFVQFDHVDRVGHEFGYGASEYYEAVSLADTLVGRIIAVLKDNGLLENAIVLLTSDHGGIEDKHGGESLAEVEIPFILYGAGIKSNFEIPHAVYIYDSAATAAFALGIDPPYSWIGRPIKSAFVGHNVPGNFYSGSIMPPPIVYVDDVKYVRRTAQISSESMKIELKLDFPDVEIRYTVDGSEPHRDSLLYTGPFLASYGTVVKAVTMRDGRLTSPIAVAELREYWNFELDDYD